MPSHYLKQCWNTVNWTVGTNCREILIAIQTFSTFKKKKIHLKMPSVKSRPFCLGLNVLPRCASLLTTMPSLYAVIIWAMACYKHLIAPPMSKSVPEVLGRVPRHRTNGLIIEDRGHRRSRTIVVGAFHGWDLVGMLHLMGSCGSVWAATITHWLNDLAWPNNHPVATC